MPNVAVVAHARKKLGGGLPGLRGALAAEGVTDPLWYEVSKSRQAAACAREAMTRGADLMAGAGFDARMIADAHRGLKERFGRAAYVYTGLRNLGGRRTGASVEVDGAPFFEGPVSCVLTGNLGRAERSPFVQVTRGQKIKVRFDRKLPYELDGGTRKAARDLHIKVHPGSIKVCVPGGLGGLARGSGV